MWWVGGWISPILVAGFTLFWSLLIYWLIGDRARDWQYGVVPYVPGESVLSIERPARGEVPPQVTLPEKFDDGDHNAPF